MKHYNFARQHMIFAVFNTKRHYFRALFLCGFPSFGHLLLSFRSVAMTIIPLYPISERRFWSYFILSANFNTTLSSLWVPFLILFLLPAFKQTPFARKIRLHCLRLKLIAIVHIFARIFYSLFSERLIFRYYFLQRRQLYPVFFCYLLICSFFVLIL